MKHQKLITNPSISSQESDSMSGLLAPEGLTAAFRSSFRFHYPRSSPERNCELLSMSVAAPTQTATQALVRNEIWGPSIQLQFKLTEFGGMTKQKTFVVGPLPAFTPQDTLVVSGLECEPDFVANDEKTVAEHLEAELSAALSEISKNLRYWIPRKTGRTGGPAPSLENLLNGYFRNEPSNWGDIDGAKDRWINVRIQNVLRNLHFLPRAWSKAFASFQPNRTSSCEVSPQFAESLKYQERRTYFLDRESGSFTRELTNIDASQTTHLDENGFPRVGTCLRAGEILIGRVSDQGEDRSARVPSSIAHDETWTVLSVQLTFQERRVRVEVRKARSLEIGDVLIDRTGHKAVVANILDIEEAQISWPHSQGELELAIVKGARETVSAFRWGDVSQYPFQPRHPVTGQTHNLPQGFVESLVQQNAVMTARELLREKSDGYFGESEEYSRYRDVLQEELLQGRYPNLREYDAQEKYSALPEGVLAAQRFLNVLGFHADFDVKSFDDRQSRLRLLTSDELEDISAHAIEETDDLSSKRIFGPTKDFVCGCNVRRRRQFASDVCPDCKVPLTRSRGRRETFAHIELASPVLRTGSLSFLAQALEYSEEELTCLLNGSLIVVKCPVHGDQLIVPNDERYAETPSTDKYSGIQAIKYLIENRGLGEDAKSAVMQRALVLPPALRGGAVSTINEAYEDVLYKNKQLKRFAASENCDSWSHRELRKSYGLLGSAAGQGAIVDAVQERLSRKGLLSKSVDFSARLQPVLAEHVEDATCVLPFSVAKELFFDFAIALLKARQFANRYLDAARHVEQESELGKRAIRDVAEKWVVCVVSESNGVWTACKVKVEEGSALKVSSSLANKLGIENVQVHVPLTFRAVREMKARVGRIIEFSVKSAAPQGWFTEMVNGRNVSEVLSSMQSLANPDGTSETLSDAVLLLALGGIPKQNESSLAENMRLYREEMNNERWLTAEVYDDLDADFTELRDAPYELQEMSVVSSYEGEGVYLPNYDFAEEAMRLRTKKKQIEEIRKLKSRMRPHD